MTDVAGSVDYSYNLLSQLTSETRNSTGVNTFTLNYTYNLGGRLSSITDPFWDQVSYSHDKVGRLSAISGSSFASVSTYASGLQYRASGALKALTYGNSKTLALGYDDNQRVSRPRLQPSGGYCRPQLKALRMATHAVATDCNSAPARRWRRVCGSPSTGARQQECVSRKSAARREPHTIRTPVCTRHHFS
jgi:YD repeat-containing protein